MNNKKQKLEKVRYEDFNIAALRRAAREGRLFLQPSELTPEQELANARDEILNYVSRIDECASPTYSDCIHSLWVQIADISNMATDLLTTRGSRQGKPNYYKVTAIVSYLSEKSVYRKYYSVVELHLKMEQAGKRNGHYTANSIYALNQKEMALIDSILQELKK